MFSYVTSIFAGNFVVSTLYKEAKFKTKTLETIKKNASVFR